MNRARVQIRREFKVLWRE